jgi:hypothetical protein
LVEHLLVDQIQLIGHAYHHSTGDRSFPSFSPKSSIELLVF